MGGLGLTRAIEAADIVIMTDEPSKIAAAIRIARKTRRVVTQIWFCLRRCRFPRARRVRRRLDVGGGLRGYGRRAYRDLQRDACDEHKETVTG